MFPDLILWPEVCSANENDSGVFWDSQISLNTSNPDLTVCFQQTALVWMPCALFCLMDVFYIPFLYYQHTTYPRWRHKTWLNISKIAVSILLLGVAIAELVDGVGELRQGIPIYNVITPAIFTLTFVLSTYLIHYEYTKGRHTSGVFFVFWVLLLVLEIVPFRSKIMTVRRTGVIEDPFLFTTFYIHWTLVLLQIIMCVFADIPPGGDKILQDGTASEKTPLLGKVKSNSFDHDFGQTREPCPESTVTWLSNITHTWIIPMLFTGYRRPLTFDDMPDILDKDKCKTITPKFEESWYKSKASKLQDISGMGENDLGKIPSLPLLITLIKSAGSPFWISGLFRFFICFTEFINPLILQAIISVVGSDDPNATWKGVCLAFLCLVVNIVDPTLTQMYFKYCYIFAMNGRTAITNAVYRKALRLSSRAKRTTTVGEIVNLMSVDAQKIHDTFFDAHEAWACPLQTIVALVFLWFVVGPASLAGLVLVLVLAPVSGFYMTMKYANLQDKQMVHKDDRVRVINEILTGMKPLKMYGWESSFRASVDAHREKELGCIRGQAYLHGSISVFWFCCPYLITLAVFTTYVFTDGEGYLDPQVAFVSSSIIQILNWCTSFLPIYLGFVAQAFISLKRVTRLMQQDEVNKDAVQQDNMMDDAVQIEDGTFTWGGNTGDKPVLRDINMSVSDGELIAIVGTVGAGKSSLIQAILGELQKLNGTVRINGSLAYIPQQAWIQHNSLQNNVLFGKSLDASKYQNILKACALVPDLQVLPGGDQTEIGEKGINLSGGQKQRVSLARAVYQNETIYLLDDPLSAVDAHVGKHIFENVIGPKGMLKGKTRILVTHGVTYLPQADKIVVMKDGRISETGTYQELLSHEGAFAEFIRTFLKDTEADSEQDGEALPEATRRELERQLSAHTPETDRSDGGKLQQSGSRRRTSSEASQTKPRRRMRRTTDRMLSRSISRRSEPHGEDTEKHTEMMKHKKLIEEEAAEVGSIKSHVLSFYVKAGGLGWLSILLVMFVFYTASIVLTNIWLSAWSDDPFIPGPEGKTNTDNRLLWYGLFGLGQVVTVAGLSLSLYLGALMASRVLHSRLIHRIMRAPMSFFDTTPLGRIVNRFTIDMDKVDVNIPMYTRWWLFNLSSVLATIAIISYTTPIFLVVVLPLGLLYYAIQRVYIAAVRQMKRIDSIRRSPIYVNFDETLVGVTSIRAFRQQQRFTAKNDKLVDESQVAYYPIIIAQRCLGFLLTAVGAFIVFFAAIFAALEKDNITAGLAGLSVSFAMQTSWSIAMMVRGATELETHVVSVERIKEYTEIEQEAEWEVEETTPSGEWPSQGKVSFNDYSTRYRSGLDLVLKKISFEVKSGEKVGIVGRTGAGKSSMALSLFRIIEATGGSIRIDGTDISLIGLHDLRLKLTVIPQDPWLYSGTIRRNLDPFNHYSEKEIWDSLELAHLKGFVSQLAQQLDYECGEGGEALSVGQRQLVCLARALLRKSKILVLDEATAAVDLETDELIQATIRSAFKQSTVLTIAHRLNTILDYDRVMVLSDGEIKEFDSPTTLLTNQQSSFYSMAKDASLV